MTLLLLLMLSRANQVVAVACSHHLFLVRLHMSTFEDSYPSLFPLFLIQTAGYRSTATSVYLRLKLQ